MIESSPSILVSVLPVLSMCHLQRGIAMEEKLIQVILVVALSNNMLTIVLVGRIKNPDMLNAG